MVKIIWSSLQKHFYVVRRCSFQAFLAEKWWQSMHTSHYSVHFIGWINVSKYKFQKINLKFLHDRTQSADGSAVISAQHDIASRIQLIGSGHREKNLRERNRIFFLSWNLSAVEFWFYFRNNCCITQPCADSMDQWNEVVWCGNCSAK